MVSNKTVKVESQQHSCLGSSHQHNLLFAFANGNSISHTFIILVASGENTGPIQTYLRAHEISSQTPHHQFSSSRISARHLRLQWWQSPSKASWRGGWRCQDAYTTTRIASRSASDPRKDAQISNLHDSYSTSSKSELRDGEVQKVLGYLPGKYYKTGDLTFFMHRKWPNEYVNTKRQNKHMMEASTIICTAMNFETRRTPEQQTHSLGAGHQERSSRIHEEADKEFTNLGESRNKDFSSDNKKTKPTTTNARSNLRTFSLLLFGLAGDTRRQRRSNVRTIVVIIFIIVLLGF